MCRIQYPLVASARSNPSLGDSEATHELFSLMLSSQSWHNLIDGIIPHTHLLPLWGMHASRKTIFDGTKLPMVVPSEQNHYRW